MQIQTRGIYRFDDFELDFSKRRLLRRGAVVPLKPKAFDLLAVLVEHNGEMLTKDDLFRLVWDEQIVEESNLTVSMSAIRKALGEKASEPKYITTVSGRGYYFNADLREGSLAEASKTTEASAAEDLIIESRTVSRITVEEDDEPEETAEAEEVTERKFLQPAPESFFRKNRAAIIAVGALLILIGGGYLLFFRRDANNGATLQTGTIRRLTNDGRVVTAALAPDGKTFAYTVRESDSESLWLGHIDGGEPIQIRPPVSMIYLSLRFASDGNSLYYVLSENFRPGSLYRIPIFGGAPEKLRDDVSGGIAFSPDEKQFASVHYDEQKNQPLIVISDTKGTGERTIVMPPVDSGFFRSSPVWSSNGELIAFAATTGDDSDYEIFTVNASGGATQSLTKQNWNGVRGLRWLPDGSGLVAIAREKNSLLWQPWQISYPDGAVRRIISDLNFYAGSIGASADGENLLMVQIQQQSSVWVAPADDLSKARQITFGSFGQDSGWNGLSWLPDGRIIYTKLAEKGVNIWTMNGDGANQKQLIPPGGDNVYPSVASDGRYVVFQSNRNGGSAIWRADANGENLIQLTRGGNAGQPALTPDGKWVVYVSSRESTGALWRISIDGGEPQRLTEREYSWIGISPDSNLIAGGFEDNGQQKIAVLSIQGGEPLQLFDAPRLANFRLGIHWTPDGKAVTYRDWANGIWKQNLSGGEPQRLEGLPTEKPYSYGWSPDGKQFAFVRGAEISDVVLINRFK